MQQVHRLWSIISRWLRASLCEASCQSIVGSQEPQRMCCDFESQTFMCAFSVHALLVQLFQFSRRPKKFFARWDAKCIYGASSRCAMFFLQIFNQAKVSTLTCGSFQNNAFQVVITCTCFWGKHFLPWEPEPNQTKNVFFWTNHVDGFFITTRARFGLRYFILHKLPNDTKCFFDPQIWPSQHETTFLLHRSPRWNSEAQINVTETTSSLTFASKARVCVTARIHETPNNFPKWNCTIDRLLELYIWGRVTWTMPSGAVDARHGNTDG